MPKYLLSFLFALGVINTGFAQDVTFENALRAVRVNCGGISDKLSEIKKLAGINTAVTGVGTVVGAGAIATGAEKSKLDKISDNLDQQIQHFMQAEANATPVEVENFIGLQTELAELLKNDELKKYMEQIKSADISPEEFSQTVKDQNYVQKLQELKTTTDEESKKFGNARTGLLATTTATNIAGAVIAGVNRIDADFVIVDTPELIVKCNSVDLLKDASEQTKMELGLFLYGEPTALDRYMASDGKRYEKLGWGI